MDKHTLDLISNNKVAINDLNRYFIDSGKLNMACNKIAKARDLEEREALIKKMKSLNKDLSDSIIRLSSIVATLHYNPDSPILK